MLILYDLDQLFKKQYSSGEKSKNKLDEGTVFGPVLCGTHECQFEVKGGGGEKRKQVGYSSTGYVKNTLESPSRPPHSVQLKSSNTGSSCSTYLLRTVHPPETG